MKTLMLLVFVHYLCDFGLQNDFIAKFKIPKSADFWFHVLGAHCAIQALGVLLVTNSPTLAGLEFAAHFTIDYNKGLGRLTFNQDQALHLLCKLTWFGVYSYVV